MGQLYDTPSLGIGIIGEEAEIVCKPGMVMTARKPSSNHNKVTIYKLIPNVRAYTRPAAVRERPNPNKVQESAHSVLFIANEILTIDSCWQREIQLVMRLQPLVNQPHS